MLVVSLVMYFDVGRLGRAGPVRLRVCANRNTSRLRTILRTQMIKRVPLSKAITTLLRDRMQGNRGKFGGSEPHEERGHWTIGQGGWIGANMDDSRRGSTEYKYFLSHRGHAVCPPSQRREPKCWGNFQNVHNYHQATRAKQECRPNLIMAGPSESHKSDPI